MIKNIDVFRYLVLFMVLGFSACSKFLETEIIIAAPIEKTWEVFSDTSSYPDWNPMILKFNGEWKKDSVIEVELTQPGNDPMVFTPTIIAFEKGRLLEWQGVFVGKWLFTGKHKFELVSTSQNETIFKQSESFNGIAIPFFDFDATKKAFEMMNEALKKRVEIK